ncbi:MAG: phosphoribosyl-ATP pyrophosphatase [Acidobacteria bacterium]|nr:phosphoribosyl-ATP pyrophosphatase [Acidobacteriota bacterium]
MKIAIDELKFDERGLIPTVVQDARTRRILTLAYMNRESLARTIDTGETWFWSRARASLWHKGETSGNTQRVVDIQVDCDGDALNVLVEAAGPACHTGASSCFHNEVREAEKLAGSEEEDSTDLGTVLSGLYSLVRSRKQELPQGSYTTYLFQEGLDKILKKVGEEAAETIIAAKNEDRMELANESADLLYHLLVLFVERGLTLAEVSTVLRDRRK